MCTMVGVLIIPIELKFCRYVSYRLRSFCLFNNSPTKANKYGYITLHEGKKKCSGKNVTMMKGKVTIFQLVTTNANRKQSESFIYFILFFCKTGKQ